MADYSALDKLLHRAALGLTPVAEMSFDMDQRLAAPDRAASAEGAHVFVSGLARAGTTVLMRRFHASGAFRSLTYRDMPFVLAPNLWKKMGGGSKKKVAAAERAHGDDLKVDADSPESLDEVFWRIFAGADYLCPDALLPHEPDAETRAKLVAYVGAILSGSGKTRYLSKNNNNILRLASIRQAFPNALILVPFRNPFSHAGSLLTQHQNFIVQQGEDPFVLRYMTWLAHHEFGRGHRPFRFDDKPPAVDPETLDYWVDLWTRTYGWLLEHAPEDAIFVSYEALCTDPLVWEGLAQLAGIDPAIEADGGFVLSSKSTDPPADAELSGRAEALYDRLSAHSKTGLNL